MPGHSPIRTIDSNSKARLASRLKLRADFSLGTRSCRAGRDVAAASAMFPQWMFAMSTTNGPRKRTFTAIVDFYCDDDRYAQERYVLDAAHEGAARAKALKYAEMSIYDDPRIPDRYRIATVSRDDIDGDLAS